MMETTKIATALSMWLPFALSAFAPASLAPPAANQRQPMQLFVKRKESMAQKRARRQAKRQRQLKFPETPKSSDSLLVNDETAAEAPLPVSRNDNDADVNTKAQELLERQRQSISVLTTVKEAVERIDENDLSASFKAKGYFVVENFLSDLGLVDAMRTEAKTLYNGETTVLDTEAQTFAGEFVTPLAGGEEQYKVGPRSVEWVVSVTKHMPSKLLELDGGNCMAQLRTYDKNARQAARELFLGEQGRDAEESHLEAKDSEAFFAVEAPDDNDLREVTLRYSLTPNNASPDAAGALTFQSTGETVQERRDCLVLYKSKTTMVQKHGWFENPLLENASCIELHLLRTSTTAT